MYVIIRVTLVQRSGSLNGVANSTGGTRCDVAGGAHVEDKEHLAKKTRFIRRHSTKR